MLKSQLFMTLKSDQDLDLDPRWDKKLDPDIESETNVDPHCWILLEIFFAASVMFLDSPSNLLKKMQKI